ncbi:MAG: hypothetical protein U0794_15810 [Isosphaeraceae bacterium]
MRPNHLASFGLTCLLLSSSAMAQEEPRAATGETSAPAGATPAAPSPVPPGSTFPAASRLPEPTPPDQLKPANIALPSDAVEPYLLTKDVGPFMVLAKTFRGPEAERFALALVLELRREHGLPAYILRTKDFANRSNIRNIPPTAPGFVKQSQLTDPEKVRTHDEAAVLVGDEKTLDASEKLLHRVKKINPRCLNEMPKLFNWRTGLAGAVRTTNPYVPTQNIFPGRIKKDTLVTQMNGGPHSVYQCPGRYTLQVAEFGGRSVFNPSASDSRLLENSWLRKSPLVTAADDAERLADRLSRDPEVQKTGAQAYVYHDRTSSKVMMGSFGTPNDPAAVRLRDSLLKLAIPLSVKPRAGFLIAPANALTDLQDPNQPIKQN